MTVGSSQVGYLAETPEMPWSQDPRRHPQTSPSASSALGFAVLCVEGFPLAQQEQEWIWQPPRTDPNPSRRIERRHFSYRAEYENSDLRSHRSSQTIAHSCPSREQGSAPSSDQNQSGR